MGDILEAEMGEGRCLVCCCDGEAHPNNKCVVKAGKDYGIGVMGDNLGCPIG